MKNHLRCVYLSTKIFIFVFLCGLSGLLLLQDGAEGANGNAENNGGKPKRKRKRDSHQQELNKQAQHRYRFVTQSMLLSCNNNILLHSLP